jgi:hypothetical protein
MIGNRSAAGRPKSAHAGGAAPDRGPHDHIDNATEIQHESRTRQ